MSSRAVPSSVRSLPLSTHPVCPVPIQHVSLSALCPLTPSARSPRLSAPVRAAVGRWSSGHARWPNWQVMRRNSPLTSGFAWRTPETAAETGRRRAPSPGANSANMQPPSPQRRVLGSSLSVSGRRERGRVDRVGLTQSSAWAILGRRSTADLAEPFAHNTLSSV